MKNKNKELRNLFNKYLVRIEEEKKERARSATYFRQPNGTTPYVALGGARILFYEWSDVYRTPKTFFTLDAFERFLSSSKIFMAPYQREMLKYLEKAFISCKKGTTSLEIRGTWEKLRDVIVGNPSMPRINTPSENNIGKGGEPYNVAITRRPPMYAHDEVDGRWPENDGTFFG